MSTTVDTKVAELRFDNRQFEQGVHQSLGTLDKLKKAFKFDNAAKGLEQLGNASKKCDLNPLIKSLDTVRLKFSKMDVMASNYFRKLEDRVESTVRRIAKTFTTEPVHTGFSEYELKMGSVQTIMASTGETIGTVNKYLDELNEYSDKTIYSFSDMTENIGKFTNAGVKLEDAVKAIQGISNEAAVSGANAQQASHAMYNFAQALSAGSVKLMDWKSIENANMATMEFKNELLKTAEELKTVKKQGDKYISTTTDLNGKVSDAFNATSLFNESLSTQWMTTDVLVKTLAKYSSTSTDIGKKAFAAAQDVKTFTMMMDTLKEAAQSGWAQTWEIMVGDLVDAKKLWTDLSNIFGDIIAKSAEARNKFVSEVMTSKWSQITRRITEAGIAMDDFNAGLKETAKGHDIDFDTLLVDGKQISDLVREGIITSDMVVETIKCFAGATDSAAESTAEVKTQLVDLKGVVDDVLIGKFGNGEERVRRLTEAGYDYAEVQNLVNRTLAGETVEYTKVIEQQVESAERTEEQTKLLKELAAEAETSGTPMAELLAFMEKPGGRELLIESFKNSLSGSLSVIRAIKTAWHETFEIRPTAVYGIIESIHEFSKKLVLNEGQMEKITDVARNLFDVFDSLVGMSVKLGKKGFRAISKALSYFDTDLLSVAKNASDAVITFRDWVTSSNLLTNSLKAFKIIFLAVYSKLRDFYSDFRRMPKVGEAIQNLSKIVASSKDNVLDFFTKLPKQLETFVEKFDKFDDISFENVQDAIGDFATSTEEDFGKIDEQFDGSMSLIDKFKEKFKFGSQKKETSGIIEGVTEIVAHLRTLISDKIGISEIFAIGLGAGMVAFLKKISDTMITILKSSSRIGKSFEKITSSIAAMFGSFEGVGTSAAKYIDSLTGERKSLALLNRSKAILNMAYAIGVLAVSLLVFSKVPAEDLKRTGIALGLVAVGLLAFAGAFAAITAITKGGTFSMNKTLLSIAASLFVLTLALSKLEDINSSEVEKGLTVIAKLAVGLLIFSAIIGKVNPKASFGFKTMLPSVLSLLIFVHVLEKLSKIDFVKIRSKLGDIAFVIAAFGIVLAMTRIAGKNAARAGIGMAGIALALFLIVPTIAMLGKIGKNTLDKATAAIAQIGVVFAGIIAVSFFAGQHAAAAGVMLFLMAGAMLILSAVMVMLGHMEWDELEKGTFAIGLIGLMFAALIASTSLAKKCKGELIVMAAVIGILLTALAALAIIPADQLSGASLALSAVIICLSILLAATRIAGKASGTVFVLGLVVAGIGAVLGALSLMCPDPQGTLSIARAISLILLSMVAALTVLAFLGPMATQAIPGIQALGGLVAGLGAIFIALDLLNQIVGGGMGESLKQGVDLLVIIGGGLGQFIGSIIGGVGAGATSQLETIGKNVAAFLEQLSGFDQTTVDCVRAVGDAMLDLSASDFIQNLSSMFGMSSFESLNDNLVGFGEGLVGFSTAVASIDVDQVKIAAEAGIAIAEMASALPNTGGLLGLIVGNNDMDKFTGCLTKFGYSINGFWNATKGINADEVKAAAEAGIVVADMASALPNSGGVLGWFVGENDMSQFKDQLKPFGEALTAFQTATSTINADTVKRSAEAGIAIAEMAASLPNEGGKISKWFGDNTMKVFSSGLEDLGVGMRAYANEVSGLRPDVIAKNTRCFGTIADVFGEFIDKAGFLPTTTLSEFGMNLTYLGNDLENYYESISNVTLAQLNYSAYTLGRLVDVTSRMSEEVNTGSMRHFGDALRQLGKVGVDGFAEAFEDSDEKVKDAVSGMVSTFATVATEHRGRVRHAVSECVKYSMHDLPMLEYGFNEHGRKFIQSLIDGIKYGRANLYTTVSAMAKRAYQKAGGAHIIEGFENAARNAVLGFANGFSKYSYIAEGKATVMANAALNAARVALDEHSPSKKFGQIGDYAGLGFVNALGSYVAKAYDAGYDVGNYAFDGVRDTLSTIRNLITSDIDMSPTIRPVMDLTSIQSGAGTIRQILSDAYGMNDANLSMAYQTASNMGHRHVDPTAMAVDKLVKSVHSLSGAGRNQITNEFYITGTNAEEIANEVSRIIQQQIERKDDSWA